MQPRRVFRPALKLLATAGLIICFLSSVKNAWSQQAGPATAKELLRLHGIDASLLDRVQNDQPLGAMDEETLVRILQRMPRFPRNALERWSLSAPEDWSAIRSAPEKHRTAIFRLSGRATKVERSPLIPELASRLEFSEYYRVTLRLKESDQIAVLCTRNVPQAWLDGGEIAEPASALGLFLKTGIQTERSSELIFVSQRVAWFPEHENSKRQVTPDKVYLASLGFDIGLLDEIQGEHKKPLGLADRECFYQLLNAVGKAKREEFVERSKRPLELVPVLRDPTAHHGELVVLEGIARRAIKLRVDDADVRERFGIDHYYQIDLFVDLNKQVIKLGKGDSGTGSAVFENSYPVTVCVMSLPADLTASDVLREHVRIHSTFFKLWSYSSNYVSSIDKSLLQISPMFIGVEPRVVRPERFQFGMGYVLAAIMVIAIIGIMVSFQRRKPRSEYSVQRSPDSDHSGTGVDGNVLPERPDFTNLG